MGNERGPQVEGFRTITIQTIINGLNAPNVKKFLVYDSLADPICIYYAQANAAAGEECLCQHLEYGTVSGIKVLTKEAWSDAVWSGALWDAGISGCPNC